MTTDFCIDSSGLKGAFVSFDGVDLKDRPEGRSCSSEDNVPHDEVVPRKKLDELFRKAGGRSCWREPTLAKPTLAILFQPTLAKPTLANVDVLVVCEDFGFSGVNCLVFSNLFVKFFFVC